MTADDVARAIVAACRETGADPIQVADGTGPDGRPPTEYVKIAHARILAAFSLNEAFGRYGSKSMIARAVGVRRFSSAGAFFSLYEQKKAKGELEWMTREVMDRVIAAIDAPTPVVHPAPFKDGPLPPPKPALPSVAPAPKYPGGKLEAEGYRYPPDTIERVLEDDDDAGPVFDRGHIPSGTKAWEPPRDSKRALLDEARRAVENTAKMTPKEE